MTHKKLLFLLPLATLSLVACGGKAQTFDYDATNELAQKYVETITESRLKPVSSHYKLDVNRLSFAGDLSIGKSISLKDFSFSAFNKTLLDVEIPASLYTTLEEKLSRVIGGGSAPIFMNAAKYLLHPEFNSRFLTIIDGIKVKEQENAKNPIWDKIEHLPWNTIKRTYAKSGDSGLKIDISIPSIKQTYEEFTSRLPDGSSPALPFDAPLSASITVDNYGYISSMSLKFDCKGLKIGDEPNANAEGKAGKTKFYINGDVNIDATISFSHTFTKVVPIRYQTIEYVEVNGELKVKENGVSGFYDNIDDVKYKREDGTEHKVFTAEWYATDKESGDGAEGYNYGCDDDPLFNYSFFNGIAKNEAFLQNNYDIVLIPDHDITSGSFEQKVEFLGYGYNGGEEISYCNITIDGNDDVFSHEGINEYTVAGDQPVGGITIAPDPTKPDETINVTGAYNFYIDKSLLKNDSSYYLITVAFIQYDGGK